jgi:hypothetical protein
MNEYHNVFSVKAIQLPIIQTEAQLSMLKVHTYLCETAQYCYRPIEWLIECFDAGTRKLEIFNSDWDKHE